MTRRNPKDEFSVFETKIRKLLPLFDVIFSEGI
jgi:hypothetical protein